MLDLFIVGSFYNSEAANAGGLIGYLYFANWDNSSYLNFDNLLIDSCNVQRMNTLNAEANDSWGIGGILGTLDGKNTAIFSMNNALLKDVTIEIGTSGNGKRDPGSIVGTDKLVALNIVGISFNGDEIKEFPLIKYTNNSSSNYGIGSTNECYIVFADYNNATDIDDLNQANPFLYDSNVDYDKILPFVTVNPSVNIGAGQILTSDGMSQTVNSSPINSILNDGLNSDGTLKPTIPLYDYSKNYLTVFNLYRSHLSTFNREAGSTISNDFMVLVVDDMKKSITTEMINSYLNLLANTNFDYTVNKSKVYSVDIYKMVYNFETSQFEKSDEEANLKSNRNDSGSTAKYFYMLGDGGDSLGTMFSLIDVKFYDPKDSSKIAYHLYVPVFVKKILKYNFTIATGSGTNYDRSWYEDNNRYGAPLLENLGSDITILFNYEYLRDQEEWNSALNNGDNTLNPINKIVTMDAVSSHLPNNAILVLVDINRGGRPYYARAGEAIVGNQLILANFHTVLDDSTSETFTPLAFNDMLTITASVDEDGNMVICDEASATVKAKIGSSDTYTFFKMADENDSGTKYTISVDIEENLIESYYVSFFTESTTENILYHYTIESPLSFNDINNPSKLNNKESLSSSVHLILGNIFEQTLSVSSLTENEEISLSGNDRLDVSMDATIQIKDTLFSQVEPYLYSEVLDIYQTFLLRLIKNDEEGRSRIIVGNPEISGSYSITSGESNLEDDYDTINKTTNYIEFINGVRLNEYLMNTSGVTINGLFSLVYDDEDTIATQFPYRKNDEDTSVCTTVNGSSNISFGNISASNSKCSISDDDLSKKYYSKLSNNKAVLYYNVIGDLFIGDYGSLGINPLDFEDMDKSNIYTMASFDISSIIDETYQTVNNERVYLYDYVRLQIRLSSKQDNYDLNEHALTLGDYFVDVWIPGASGETGYSEAKSGSTYTFILPRNWTEESVNTNLVIPIYYKVLTGSEFENNGYYYSNYKITLTADLIRYGENDEIVSYSYSTDTDYIIYTNARIYPDFLD